MNSGLKRVVNLIFLFTLIILGNEKIIAQFNNGTQMEFGKNRVQYSNKDWVYFRFTKFDTYFYEGGRELALYASTYANQELQRIGKKIDYELEEKIRFIIFNDLSDLKETNIGLITDEDYNVGGITHIIDNKVFIYFNGTHSDFEQQIKLGISDILLQQLMYGGSTSSKVKSSILLSFPAWYTDGLKSYLSKEWDTHLDDVLRQGIVSGKFKRFYQLTAEEQICAGHSIWRYINDKYGEKAISEILYMAKINRSIEGGFLFILGISYDMLLIEWHDWYLKKYSLENEISYDENSNLLIKKPKKGVVYSNFKISSDGKFAAYSTNEVGKTKIFLKNLETGKTKKLMKFGQKLNEKVDYSYPILTWAPQGDYLSIIREKKADNILFLYNLEENSWRKRYLMNFDRVLSISYNSAGNLLAMSAVKNGQSDIYLYNVGANSYTQITKDIYDDEQPVFINNSTALLFSSNRINDTLKFDVETAKNFKRDTLKGQSNNDIFLLDLKNNSQILKRITETPLCNESFPLALSYNTFVYLSDQNGIQNRYLAKFDSTIAYIDTTTHYRYITKSFGITNKKTNLIEHNINPSAGYISEIFIKNNSYYLNYELVKPSKDYTKSMLISTNYMQELAAKKYNSERQEIIKKQQLDSGLVPNNIEETKKRFKVIYVDNNENPKNNLDINNYSFSQNNQGENKTPDNQKPKEETAYLFNQRNYEVQYSINQAVTQIDFNYLNFSYQPFSNPQSPIYLNPGFNVFMKFGVQDLFENYRITAGVRLVGVVRDNEYFVSFTNLKRRLDKEITFHRKILNEGDQESYYIKHYIHDGILKLSFAIDNVKSIRSIFIFTNDIAANLASDRTNLMKSNKISNKVGLRLEYVFDNTRQQSFNILYGTRYKVFGEYYQPMENLKQNLFVLGIDYRKYIKIHKTFVWANRIAASTSFGSQKLIYYMGGVDNALYQNFNTNIQIAKDQNYTYQTLATNMRGFDQNIRNGNNFVLINSELRMPLFQYLSSKPVKSSFLNNFMVIGFCDVGTAWTGYNPFSDSNSLYIQKVEQTPITVTIVNQNDPIVVGYGFGLRTKIFGYYTRLDFAWGIQNQFISRNKIHLSLSLDF